MGVSVGIVGVGQFGPHFIRMFRDHPLVDRVALCDLHADRLAAAAKEFEIAETYPSLDALCASDVEAVALFTQPWLHAPQAVQALEAGKHVYSAVPVVSMTDGEESLEWCDRLIETCRRTGLHYMMGETSWYRPEAMYCRRRAAEGAFGHFVHAEGEYFHDIDHGLWDVMRKRWGEKFSPDKTGSPPMYYPTHSIGGFLSVMGARATEVSAFGYVYPNDDWARADTIWGNTFANETALFRLSNGATARVCEYRRIGHACREGFRLYGTEGSLDDGSGGPHWVTKDGCERLTLEQMRDPLPPEVLAAYQRGADGPDAAYGGHGGSHAYLVHEFVDAIAAGRRPVINAWQAVRIFAPGIVAHKSAVRDGELMKVPDWGDPPE